MKRSLSLLALVALLTAMLAACGGAPAAQPTTAPAEPATSAPAPTEAAAATEVPTEAAAATEAVVATEAPTEAAAATDAQTIEAYLTEMAGQLEGVDLGTIKVASQSPLSGPQSVLGVSIGNSSALAVKQYGELLAATGATFEAAPFDDQAQPEVGSANAKAIVSDPDILCVVGHLNSGVALAALPDYQNASLPMVSPANTSPKITESGFPNAFRVVGRDDLQGPLGARFAVEELGAKNIYIIHDKTEYGQGVAEFFKQEAEKLGATTALEGVADTETQFDSIITPILAANPDLIYFGGIYSQAGLFFRQAREKGIEAKFLGPDGLDSSELAKLAGEALEGSYYTTVSGPVTIFPSAAQFATDYKAEYGEAVQPFGAQSYDSAGLCFSAIVKAAVDAKAKPTREQVLAAMQDLPALTGITGASYKFTDKGDPTEAAYYFLVPNSDPALWNDNKLAAVIKSAPPEN
ncbi:MAG: branched-chain amino acid ABC transporter substrate-binding protein [Chloroflexales bacterium]|nr:branched-chain amino acid ABC transporter substrate-binding protein [Chloroflexales bacterium]